MLKSNRTIINDFTKKTAYFLLAVLICFISYNNIAMADTITDYESGKNVTGFIFDGAK